MRQFHHRTLAASPIVAACGLCLTACAPHGSMTLLLTDAPSPEIAHAVVTIDEIYLQGGAGGRFTLRDTPATVDLLTLANSVATLVEDEPVPAGRWQELRLVIGSAFLEVIDAGGGSAVYASDPDALPEGEEADGSLQTPSYAATGLKVKLTGPVEVEGDQQLLLIDFDVAESFGHEAGDRWVMHPVVEATDLVLTASVRVEIDAANHPELWPALAAATVELVDHEGFSEGELPLDDADGDGRFTATFLYLNPSEGPFSVELDVAASVAAVLDLAFPLTADVGSGLETTVSAAAP